MVMKLKKGKIAIGFSGGKESIRLVKMLKNENPILLTYLPNDDTRGLRALFRYFAKNEGLEIHIIYGKENDFKEDFYHDERGIVHNYRNPLLEIAKELGIEILYMGRRQSDFHVLKNVHKPNIEIKGMKIEFPLWER